MLKKTRLRIESLESIVRHLQWQADRLNDERLAAERALCAIYEYLGVTWTTPEPSKLTKKGGPERMP